MERRVALVTGASRGIGKAIALKLGQAGYCVIVGCKVRTDLARETANEICKAGGRADFFQADVCDTAAIRALYDFTRRNFGYVDTVVNNAGIARYGLLTDESDQTFDEVIGTNLKGVFNVCRAYIPDMAANKFGRIINVSSIWGLCGASCESLYSASKAGVIGLTKSLAKELGPSGITVNAIAPGVIQTDMLSCISEQTVDELRDETPIGRNGTPDDIASAAAFLASEGASFVTGEVINCSGGFVI